MPQMPFWVSWVTFGIAVVGAVLGVMNTWRAILREKPRLDVRPLWFGQTAKVGGGVIPFSSRLAEAFDEADGPGMFGVEVINRGFVTVHIREVGVCPNGLYLLARMKRYKEPAGRLAVAGDARRVHDFPITVEPGRRVAVGFGGPAIYTPEFARAGRVYAYTEDERLFTGHSALLDRVVAHSRNPTG